MTGTPRRLGRLVGLALAVGIAALIGAVLEVGVAAAEGPDAPTVSFSGAVPPLSCASQPSTSSITVPPNGKVRVENRIGEPAWLLVGDEQVMQVGAETGVLLKLKRGLHEVRLMPACMPLAEGAATPVMVIVGSGAPMASPTPSGVPTSLQPSGSSGTDGAPRLEVPGPSSITPQWSDSSPPQSSRATASPAAPANAVGVSEPERPALEPLPGPSSGAVVIEVSAYALEPVAPIEDSRRVRVVAVIAAICVIGAATAAVRVVAWFRP